MTSQRVERTWIRTGGYGRFRGEWVNNLRTILQNENLEDEENIIIGGDFNCPLTESIPRQKRWYSVTEEISY